MTEITAPSHILQSEENDLQTRVVLLVEYCGKFFYGSQFQPNKPTIQDAIQNALLKLNLSCSAVSFAGRTDAGVSAHGQVAHFDIVENGLVNIPDFVKALNAVLPSTIAVRDAYINTGKNFNSRRDAYCKWYRYSIYNAPNRSAWANQHACIHYPRPLNVERMAEASHLLKGSHNFQSFKDSKSAIKNDICNVYYADVSLNSDFITFDIIADRFLYKMVRNLAGQLIAIGSTKRSFSPEMVRQIMEEKDRSKAAITARPEGLALMAVLYQSPFNFFDQDVYIQQLKNILKPMESLQNENLFRKAS